MEMHPCSCIRRLPLVKMAILPRLTWKLITIFIRIPDDSFVENDKLILKFMWNFKRPRIAKPILKKNKTAYSHSLMTTFMTLLFVTSLAALTKAVWCWLKDRHGVMHKIESPETDLCSCGFQRIFDIGAKPTQQEIQALQQMLGRLAVSMQKGEGGPLCYNTDKI